eukprot:CAMPEP_0177318384 /NCGR_PEP_ID=MMETSP0368-20130122/14043_1 /TAXON_ID=447022 ORGANISM="Scrippsiella hangoei-like, Strain SHHI-4" /NCGR_SAMPLE_ID=MMETSP0368 /ASSEMBLY_ACC=CAM_ASM_000363 /LENGTH=37 /DNA_ID= /DNA_START= /DNA_END= /DNA_ORIENTATION=
MMVFARGILPSAMAMLMSPQKLKVKWFLAKRFGLTSS